MVKWLGPTEDGLLFVTAWFGHARPPQVLVNMVLREIYFYGSTKCLHVIGEIIFICYQPLIHQGYWDEI